MVEEREGQRKTLKNYLLKEGIGNRTFSDRHNETPYEVIDIYEGIGAGYSSAYMKIRYLGKEYKEEEHDIRSVVSALNDLEHIVETAKV